jgi:hypothetical protein
MYLAVWQSSIQGTSRRHTTRGWRGLAAAGAGVRLIWRSGGKDNEHRGMLTKRDGCPAGKGSVI